MEITPLAPWRRPAVRGLTSVVLVLTWAVLVGSWTPRGPLTTGSALTSLAVSLLVGVAVGVVARNRWAIVLAPVLFALAVEAVRVDAIGPTVDRPHLSTYGVMALVVGRGVHGLLALVPLALGVSFGAAFARRRDPSSPPAAGSRLGLGLRRGAAVVTSLALVVLVAGLVRPPRTAAIVDADGNRVPGSIAERTSVEVDGRELGLLIRGHDAEAPVLLFLAGGPGGSEMGAMRRHLAELEEHVVVVTWDQRGTGTSYRTLDPVETLTLDAAVDDTIAVADHLRERFGQERIYLLGQSWGSTLGVLAVEEAPDRFAAFIGTGQMVSPRATDEMFWSDTLAWAERTGRDGLVRELRSIGPPPYDSILDYETALSHEHEVEPYDRSGNSEGAGGFSENLFVEEYSLIEQVHLLGGFLDTFTVLYPQLQDIDLREDVARLEVPVFFVQGAHEARGRAVPFEEWYRMLDAPSKDVVHLATSGHRPLFEQPDEFVAYVADTVLGGEVSDGGVNAARAAATSSRVMQPTR